MLVYVQTYLESYKIYGLIVFIILSNALLNQSTADLKYIEKNAI